MKYVFISYSSRNQDAANTLRNILNTHNINTWMAPDSIPLGSSYSTEIKKAIGGCACFIPLMTKEAQQSKWVVREIDLAINSHRAIIPILLGYPELNDVFRFYFSDIQCYGLNNIESDSREIQALLKQVEKLLGRVKAPDAPRGIKGLREKAESLFTESKIVDKEKITYKKNYEKRIVAFVDVLGFKHLVEDSITDMYSYKKILDSLERFRRLKNEKEQQYVANIEVTTFSDSLVISYPVKNGDIDALYSILSDLTFLQAKLIENNVIIRGGIALGELHHTQSAIFGPAMNDAYYLESKKAKYPRIVICEETIDKYISRSSIKDENEMNLKKIKKLLIRDNENRLFYLDFLGNPDLFTSSTDYKYMLQIVESIIKRGKLMGDSNIIEKYDWLEKYYNAVLMGRKDNYPDEY